MTENDIRAKINAIGNEVAKVFANRMYADDAASLANISSDALALMGQFLIDIHRIAERKE